MVIPKGPGCAGCPFQSAGDWMVPDEEDTGQKTVILGQNPGESEERGQKFVRWATSGGEIWESHSPAPLLGKSGWNLDHDFLPLAGLGRADVRCANVIRCRVRGRNELPPLTQSVTRDAIRHCQRAYFQLGEGRTIVALGAYSLWAVSGEYGGDDEDNEDDSRASHSIAGWRGWVLPYRPQWKYGAANTEPRGAPHRVTPSGTSDDGLGGSNPPTVFCTYHPAFYYRAHWLKAVGRADFQRLGRYLKGTWPEPLPKIRTTLSAGWNTVLAFDTEYQPWDGGALIRMSAAWRNQDDEPSVHVIEAHDLPARVRPPETVIMHNAEADWPYLRPCFGTDDVQWDDTMYAHSVLYGSWRHTLDFLGSLYARTNRWKHLEQSDPLTYSGLDALATWDIWGSLSRELARDPSSQDIYERELKPLLPHLLRRPSIRLDAQRVTEYTQVLKGQQQEAADRGAVAAGWPLKVSSPDMVARWIGVKH